MCKLGFCLKGPTIRERGVEACKSVKLDITAGSYKFGIDPRLCGDKLKRLKGSDIYKAGSNYTLTVSQEDIQPKVGPFTIGNNTGENSR